MPLLESCYCCTLFVASTMTGVYTLVAYGVAFSLELWWILEAEVSLPAPAYVLCAGYFFSFLLSGLLLVGLTLKRTLYMLGWLFVMVLFAFPEAGLVMFMSLYYWQVESMHGLTELVYWVCRIFFNVAGIVCVQSLYVTWKEEKMVMKRLQDLNMASMITDSANVGNGHMKNGGLAYQNAAFVNSTNYMNGKNGSQVYGVNNLRRSASSASQFQMAQRGSLPFGGSLPANGLIDQTLTPLNTLRFAFFDKGSEFNASSFNGLFGNNGQQNELGLAGVGLSSNGITKDGLVINRTRSLIGINQMGNGNNCDFWNYPLSSRPASIGYIDYIHPDYATQSLDRRKYMRSLGPRRAASMDELTLNRINSDRYTFQKISLQQQFPYPSNGSKTSLGAESDDLQKYRDVAL